LLSCEHLGGRPTNPHGAGGTRRPSWAQPEPAGVALPPRSAYPMIGGCRPQNRMPDPRPGPPRCGGGPTSMDGRMTACVAGVNEKGFPRRSGNFRRAVGTVEDGGNSSLTSTRSMSGWLHKPTLSRLSGSTWPHSDWRPASGLRLGGSPGLSVWHVRPSPSIVGDPVFRRLGRMVLTMQASSSTTGTRGLATEARRESAEPLPDHVG
jgi:hypothetical protein